jgi:hypothetical protein
MDVVTPLSRARQGGGPGSGFIQTAHPQGGKPPGSRSSALGGVIAKASNSVVFEGNFDRVSFRITRLQWKQRRKFLETDWCLETVHPTVVDGGPVASSRFNSADQLLATRFRGNSRVRFGPISDRPDFSIHVSAVMIMGRFEPGTSTRPTGVPRPSVRLSASLARMARKRSLVGPNKLGMSSA